MEKTDAILCRESCSGSKEAFRELYDRYSVPLFNFIRRYAGNDELAQDLLQETFVKVWRSAGSYNARRGSFKGWLYTIALNITRNEMNRKRYRSRYLELDRQESLALSDPGDDPRTLLEKSEASRKVSEALCRLKDIYREVIILKNMQCLTFREIAEVTATPEGTIKARYHRAVNELKSYLSDLEL